MSDDLQAMVPKYERMTVHVGDDDKEEVIVIRQMKVGQLPIMLEAIAPLAHHFAGAIAKGDSAAVDPFKLFTENAGAALDLLAISLGRPREWVNSIESDEAMVLFVKMLEVNLDFFIQSVVPSVSRAMVPLLDALNKRTKTPSLGPKPSKLLSQMVTATGTSSSTPGQPSSPSGEPVSGTEITEPQKVSA